MTDIYADGIGNVRLAGTNARIDLLVVGDQPDQEGNPTMQKKAELIILTRVDTSKYTNTKCFRPTHRERCVEKREAEPRTLTK